MQKLLFTGSSGFLGFNILERLGELYEVETLNRINATYQCDLSVNIPTFDTHFDTILHAAGKAHIEPKTESEKQLFYDINCKGTENLCHALERSGLPKSFIFISTVAVYGCDTGLLIDETFPLNGVSPYADSKKKAELFLIEWCKKNNIILTILRPSLLAGKNPSGNLDAMIRGISSGKYFSIAGGTCRKSVAMAIDIAHIVPLCEQKGGIYNLCDSHNPSFKELEALISKQLGKNKPANIPYSIAKLLAKAGDIIGRRSPINSQKLAKIINPLTFSNTKIISELGFTPTDVLTHFKIQ